MKKITIITLVASIMALVSTAMAQTTLLTRYSSPTNDPGYTLFPVGPKYSVGTNKWCSPSTVANCGQVTAAEYKLGAGSGICFQFKTLAAGTIGAGSNVVYAFKFANEQGVYNPNSPTYTDGRDFLMITNPVNSTNIVWVHNSSTTATNGVPPGAKYLLMYAVGNPKVTNQIWTTLTVNQNNP